MEYNVKYNPNGGLIIFVAKVRFVGSECLVNGDSDDDFSR